MARSSALPLLAVFAAFAAMTLHGCGSDPDAAPAPAPAPDDTAAPAPAPDPSEGAEPKVQEGTQETQDKPADTGDAAGDEQENKAAGASSALETNAHFQDSAEDNDKGPVSLAESYTHEGLLSERDLLDIGMVANAGAELEPGKDVALDAALGNAEDDLVGKDAGVARNDDQLREDEDPDVASQDPQNREDQEADAATLDAQDREDEDADAARIDAEDREGEEPLPDALEHKEGRMRHSPDDIDDLMMEGTEGDDAPQSEGGQ